VTGSIDDDAKPYEFGEIAWEGSVIRSATHLYGKPVALMVPSFESAAGQNAHWNKHGTGAPGEFPAMSEDEYVRRAREIVRNGVRADAGPASKYLKVYLTQGGKDPEAPKGRTYLYNSSTKEFLSIDETIEGHIKTYFRPQDEDAYWARQQGK
jgi:pyocin large subunit-like protein